MGADIPLSLLPPQPMNHQVYLSIGTRKAVTVATAKTTPETYNQPRKQISALMLLLPLCWERRGAKVTVWRRAVLNSGSI